MTTIRYWGFLGQPQKMRSVALSVASLASTTRTLSQAAKRRKINSMTTAVLGGEVDIQSPSGKRLRLRVPPETQKGHLLRLRGQGMPHVDQPTQHGDLFARVQVVIPTKLTSEERSLLERFAELRRKQKKAA